MYLENGEKLGKKQNGRNFLSNPHLSSTQGGHESLDCYMAYHYDDVRMGAIASQITSLTIVYSTVYPDADQRKHQSPASLAVVRGIRRDRWIPRTKGQLRGKCFHLMTSSWHWGIPCSPWANGGPRAKKREKHTFHMCITSEAAID